MVKLHAETCSNPGFQFGILQQGVLTKRRGRCRDETDKKNKKNKLLALAYRIEDKESGNNINKQRIIAQRK